MKNLKILFSLFILFFIYILLSAYSYSKCVSENLSNNILRMHIIANSDSSEDQFLKLKIRDNLISYLNSIIPKDISKKDILELINSHKNDISAIIYNTISEYGYSYSYSISVEKNYYPQKTFKNYTLPEGMYDSITINIGKHSGENWWCIMYPQLSFNSNSYSFNELSEEAYALISSNKIEYKIKFKILELFNLY